MADRMRVTSLMTSKHNAAPGCNQRGSHRIRPHQAPESHTEILPCSRGSPCSEVEAPRAPVFSPGAQANLRNLRRTDTAEHRPFSASADVSDACKNSASE